MWDQRLTKDFLATRETYGDVSVLDTRDYLYRLQQGSEHVIALEKGVRLIATLSAVSEPDEKGMCTMMCTLNGQMRPVVVRDRSIHSDVKATEKAGKGTPEQIAAPFAGAVTISVAEGTPSSKAAPSPPSRQGRWKPESPHRWQARSNGSPSTPSPRCRAGIS